MKSQFALIIILFQFATVLAMANSSVNNKLCVLKAKQLLELSTREDQKSIEIDSNFNVQNSKKNQPKLGIVSTNPEGFIYRRHDYSAKLSTEYPSLAIINAPSPKRKIKAISLFYTDTKGRLDFIKKYEFDQIQNTCVPVDLVEVLAKPEFTKECTDYFNAKTKDKNKNYFSDPIHRINCQEMIATGSEELFLPTTQKISQSQSSQGTR